MMDIHPHYDDGSCAVTRTALKTARRTFRLAQIEQTRLHRPGLGLAAALMAGCWGFAWVFERILYDHERLVLIAVPVLLLPLLSRIGILSLQYRGMGGDGRVYGGYRRLARVRAAVDAVLEEQEHAA